MKNVNAKVFWVCICAGVAIRFALMAIGHNFDFESYCIVGELAAAGKNIYASTTRYNYGPAWFLILELLYRLASFFQQNILIYRIMIVALLTLTDFVITLIISRRAGNFWGIVFFLNPFSMFNDGYNNQFDNLAVLLGMLGILCLEKASADKEVKANDLYGVLLLSMSLITKHIMWAFPVWLLLNKTITIKKKFLYAFIPPLLFLVSFMPYLPEGWNGILHNVFMYRADNNFPLAALVFLNRYGIFLPFQQHICFLLFAAMMSASAYVFRRETITDSFLLYTIAVTCFASAIYSHYLLIPIMAIILIFRQKVWIYFFLAFTIIVDRNFMHIILVWCLLFYLVHYYRNNTSR